MRHLRIDYSACGTGTPRQQGNKLVKNNLVSLAAALLVMIPVSAGATATGESPDQPTDLKLLEEGNKYYLAS